MWESIDSILLFPSYRFDLIAGQLGIEFCIVLDDLEDKEQGSTADGSGILCQVILSLPLGWTHAQQESCEVTFL